MRPEELGALADVLAVLDELLTPVLPAHDHARADEYMHRLSVVKCSLGGLAAEMRINVGYLEVLPDAPMRDLRRETESLRKRLVELGGPAL